jgi:hypothetical protein
LSEFTKISFISFTKLENRRAEMVLSGEAGTSGRGEEVGKSWERVNVMQILYTYVCKWKK